MAKEKTKEKIKYSIDKRGMYHKPNGRFVSLSEIREAKRTDLPTIQFTDSRGKSISGKALSKRYAHTFKCKCRIIDKKYKTKLKGKFKKEDYPVIEHYYTISTSSKDDKYLRTLFRISHDNDYPDHRLIEANHTSWREMKLEL